MLHVVIPQSTLSPAIATVSRAVASRPTHPILGNIKLVADEDAQTLTLTAFDLNIAIVMPLSAQVVTGGAITLPSKLLGDIVSRLPDEDVTIFNTSALEEATNLVSLTCGSGKYQLNGLPVTEFPELPNIDSDESFDIAIATLRAGLAATLIAVSQDETKRILTGVHFVSAPDYLEFAATDGHRLSVIKTLVEDGQEFVATIPAKALKTLDLLIGNQDLPITMRADDSNAIFELPNGTLITRLLDGTYPNYRQLIPTSLGRKITLERKLLMSALERISVLADTKNNIVKITVDNDAQEISLSVESPDVAAGREALAAQVSGDDLEIAFNVKYLADGLKTLHTNEIQLQLNLANNPALACAYWRGMSRLILLMPVQIRN
jgi:DNA polymerase III, beta subunit